MTAAVRVYPRARVKGYAPWKPTAKTLALIEAVESVLADYAAQLPLSVRQLFYILIGRALIEKNDRVYQQLGEHLNRARRAGLIGWDMIRDDGAILYRADVFADPAEFWATVEHWARGYRRDPLLGQARNVELWCEAGGMVPQLRRVAEPYGVAVYSGGGFDSLTAKHDAACRVLADDERPTIVLHVGDFDPSGLSIYDSVAADVTAFVAAERPGWVELVRVAVTPKQIEKYRLPTAPPKKADKRGNWTGETVQCEAIPPDALAREVKRALEKHLDLDRMREVVERGEAEREEIVEAVRGLAEGNGP